MRARWNSVLLVLALLTTGFGTFARDEKSEQAIVKSFKQFAAELIGRYGATNNESIQHWQMPPCETPEDLQGMLKAGVLPSQWEEQHPHFRKGRYEPSTDYAVDVRKTDSLISPYVGIIEFHWLGRYGACAKTPEEAQASPVSDKVEYGVKYRYTFAFQDGAWVPQGREIGGADPDKWTDCKGNKSDFGCHVGEPSQSAGGKDSKQQ
jgi:hypothetical protein